MKSLLGLAAVLGFAIAGRCEGQDAAATAEELKKLLVAYDKAKGGDTIPIERAIIRLRNAGAGKELVPFLSHKRFGFVVAWALAEIGDESHADAVLNAFQARKADGRHEMAFHMGAFRTEGVRGALRTLRDDSATQPVQKELLRIALLRAGDEKTEKEVLDAIGGSDVAACARALLLAGDSRRADLLPKIAGFARDTRPLGVEIQSRFPVEKKYPALQTLADAAVEAASRLVAPTTPELIAWWYEAEELPRFPAGADGAALLQAYLDAAAKAAADGGIGPEVAVDAVVRKARAQGGDGRVRIVSIAYTEQWEIGFRRSGKTGTGTIDREGNVTIR